MRTDERPALTVEEVAERLAVVPRTVRNLLNRGELKGFRVGRVWRIAPEDFDAFLRGLPEEEPSAEELADAEAGWREYLEGIARPWEEVRRELGLE